MKLLAIQKARDRIERAEAALNRIIDSRNFASFAAAWSDFLTLSNSIFSILEKGSQSDPTSKQWYYSTKKRGRADALVCYMVQARNADEHGIEPVVAHVPGGIAIGKRGEAIYIENLIIDGRNGTMSGTIGAADGKFPSIEVIHPRAKLVPVKDDRFGNKFDPPAEHLGEMLSDQSPRAVATLMLRYVSDLVAEAAKRAR